MSSKQYNLLNQIKESYVSDIPKIDNNMCLKYLSYIIIYILFIISFYCVYNKNVSLLGILLLYLTNIIYSIFTVKDLLESQKKNTNQLITFIIFSIVLINVLSSTVIISTLKSLHATYAKNEENIQISSKSRKLISIYIAMWITVIIFLFILCTFYFIEPPVFMFFDYNFNNKSVSPMLLLISFFLKVILSVGGVGLSGYMMYLATIFSSSKIKTIE